jgi:hypothetical protein
MKVAKWWILDNKLDHFKKAVEIRDLLIKKEKTYFN